MLSSLLTSKLNTAQNDASLDYRAILADLALKYGRQDEATTGTVADFVNSIDLHEVSVSRWDRLASATDVCLREGRTTPQVVLKLVRECPASSLDHDDLLALCSVRAHLEGEAGEEVESILRPEIVAYWEDAIEDDIRQNGILADLFTDDDMIEGERLVEETVEEILAEYKLKFDSKDVNAICAYVDVASEIESNRERAGGDDKYESQRESGWGGVDAIDDLFEIDGPIGGAA